MVDVFWTGGIRYGMTVGTVAGTSIPISGGSGDALPAQDTAVTIDEQTVLDSDFDGDKVEIMVAMSTKRGHLDIQDSSAGSSGGGVSLDATELTANEPHQWVADQGITNPLASSLVGAIVVTNGDSSAAATFKIGFLYNSDS